MYKFLSDSCQNAPICSSMKSNSGSKAAVDFCFPSLNSSKPSKSAAHPITGYPGPRGFLSPRRDETRERKKR